MAARTGLEPATSVLSGQLRVAVTTSKIKKLTLLTSTRLIGFQLAHERLELAAVRLSAARSSIERYALSVLNTALEDRLELPT